MRTGERASKILSFVWNYTSAVTKTIGTSHFQLVSMSFNLSQLHMSFCIISNWLDKKMKSLLGNYKYWEVSHSLTALLAGGSGWEGIKAYLNYTVSLFIFTAVALLKCAADFLNLPSRVPVCCACQSYSLGTSWGCVSGWTMQEDYKRFIPLEINYSVV